MTEQGSSPKDEPSIEVHYIKSNYFRVIYVGGAYGGISPDGMIYAAVYNQRRAIPQKTKHLVKDGKLVEVPEGREGKKGFVREIEANLIFDLGAAEAFRKWLDEKITDMKAAIREIEEGRTNEPRLPVD